MINEIKAYQLKPSAGTEPLIVIPAKYVWNSATPLGGIVPVADARANEAVEDLGLGAASTFHLAERSTDTASLYFNLKFISLLVALLESLAIPGIKLTTFN